jgi:hypothetical protein
MSLPEQNSSGNSTEELHELKELGVLTEEEFLSKKTIIMDDMN